MQPLARYLLLLAKTTVIKTSRYMMHIPYIMLLAAGLAPVEGQMQEFRPAHRTSVTKSCKFRSGSPSCSATSY
jgi:hypothetical protein